MKATCLLLICLVACTRDEPTSPCDPDIILPAGFCAVVFADSLGAARHIVVEPDGDVHVAAWNRDGAPGGVVSLRDTDRDGRADMVARTRDAGGSGIALHGDFLYHSLWTGVLRYRLVPDQLAPKEAPDTVLSGLPESGHAARSIVVTPGGALFVNIGAPTNACQANDRGRSAGRDPCPELNAFAGIWKFDAMKVGQQQRDGERYVSGLRHAVAFTRKEATDDLYVVQHGRDELGRDWPRGFNREDGALTPAEELIRLRRGANYGWPYCYFDGRLRKRVLAPEYGGDGHSTRRCEEFDLPLMALPAHWAPNGIAFYSGNSFPQRYSGGAFITFHGGWFRDPPHNGFNIGFVTFRDGHPYSFEIFASGFAGKKQTPSGAKYRPVGLALANDGALMVTDDVRGRVWRITYTSSDGATSGVTASSFTSPVRMR